VSLWPACPDTISQRRVAIEVAGLGGSADLTGKYRFLIDIGPDWCIDCIARIGCDTADAGRYGSIAYSFDAGCSQMNMSLSL